MRGPYSVAQSIEYGPGSNLYGGPYSLPHKNGPPIDYGPESISYGGLYSMAHRIWTPVEYGSPGPNSMVGCPYSIRNRDSWNHLLNNNFVETLDQHIKMVLNS